MEIKNVDTKQTLMKRVTTPVTELPEVMGRVYGEIAAFMQKQGIPFAGPPYALYRNMDMNALDVEIGFPVAAHTEGTGDMKAGTIPGGSIASGVHVGSYSTIEQTYTALTAFIRDQGRTPTDWMYESYLNDPGQTPPEELQTEICFPLTD